MPTYEYVCKRCGHLFEIVQSMKDDTLTECPECGGELRKVFAPPAISFKGSGFYATDHGKKKSSPARLREEEGRVHHGEEDRYEEAREGQGSSGGSERKPWRRERRRDRRGLRRFQGLRD